MTNTIAVSKTLQQLLELHVTSWYLAFKHCWEIEALEIKYIEPISTIEQVHNPQIRIHKQKLKIDQNKATRRGTHQTIEGNKSNFIIPIKLKRAQNILRTLNEFLIQMDFPKLNKKHTARYHSLNYFKISLKQTQ